MDGFDFKRNATNNKHSESEGAANFPKIKKILWDKTPIGEHIYIHPSHFRKPRLCIPEKVLRLVQHQCENYGINKFIFLGTLVVETDEEGIQLQVDRLDTRNVATAETDPSSSDFSIPIKVINNAVKSTTLSSDDYISAIKNLQERCCSKATVDLASFLCLQGQGSFYSGAQSSVVHLDVDLITMGTVFKATPISPVPIVPTALSKNLAGPMSLSQIQGTPKSGYLTMDPARKLLLVLESDPKTATLPTVGIWISGIELVHHPYVWASCLRYLHNAYIHDRVCRPPEEFLVLLYTPRSSRPEFYQCSTLSNNSNLAFHIYSGFEAANLNKALGSSDWGFTEIEFNDVTEEAKLEAFKSAIQKHKQFSSAKGHLSSCDIEPRSVPTPHMEKVPKFRPMVPDVSVYWNEANTTSMGDQAYTSNHILETTNQALVKNPVSLKFQQSPLMSSQEKVPVFINTRQNYVNQTRFSEKAQHSFQNAFNRYVTPSSLNSCANQENLMETQHAFHPHDVNKSKDSQYLLQNTANGSQLMLKEPPHLTTTAGFFSKSANMVNQMSPVGTNQMPVLTPAHSVFSKQHALKNNQNVPSPQYKQSVNQILPYTGAPVISSQGQLFYNQSEVKENFSTLSNSHYIPSNPIPQNLVAQNINQNSNSMKFLKTVVEESETSLLSHNVSSVDKRPEIASNENGSMNSSSRASCMSSDDDSGLSVTPDRENNDNVNQVIPKCIPPNGINHLNGSKNMSGGKDLSSESPGLNNINWENVPSEVRVLINNQNEQLRELQRQVQLLLLNQSQRSTNHSNPVLHSNKAGEEERSSSENKSIEELNALSTNVMGHFKCEGDQDFLDFSSEKETKSAQTSPMKMDVQKISPVRRQSPESNRPSIDMERSGQTPSDLQHESVVPTNSTTYDSRSDDPVSQEINFSPDQEKQIIHEQTSIDSHVQRNDTRSQSHSISRLDSSPEPNEFVSELDESGENYEDDDELVCVDDTIDPKFYYSKLMNNIQLFLSNEKPQEEDKTVRDTTTEIISKSEQTEETVSPSSCSEDINNMNFLSMVLGGSSDTGKSMEINAMAMKYLKDEQLTQMAKLRQLGGPQASKPSYTAKILQQVINGENTSASNKSYFGISPNNMTLATQKYLERYGLLNEESAYQSPITDSSLLDQSLKLKTDFSLALSARDLNSGNLSPRHNQSPRRDDLRRNILSRGEYFDQNSLPDYTDTSETNRGTEKPKPASPRDGASPVFRNSNPYTKGNFNQNGPSHTNQDDEENILDIEKLKQLPKLL